MLLFGEYTVLAGSQALAVPLTCWSGSWQKTPFPSKEKLNLFLLWLKESGLAGEEAFHQMEKEFEAGWRFNADIPVGHGVGSSGAYVAAIFDRYVKHAQEVSEEDTASRMAKMEGYFHGTSSGMDPLVSLTQKAVLKDTSGIFHVVEDPGWPAGFEVYLWDSRIDRTTSTLVEIFKKKIQDPEIRISLDRQLIPMVDHAIHFYLSGSASMLAECISVISQFQLEHFTEMIPPAVRPVWEWCAGQQGVYMKICGAGGGGYYIIISTEGKNISLPGLIQVH